MLRNAGEVFMILCGVAALAALPYLLYWLVWIFTVWDLPPQGEPVEDTRTAIRRAEETWALKTLSVSALGVGIFRFIMFVAVR